MRCFVLHLFDRRRISPQLNSMCMMLRVSRISLRGCYSIDGRLLTEDSLLDRVMLPCRTASQLRLDHSVK
jgi:hypothetical protein